MMLINLRTVLAPIALIAVVALAPFQAFGIPGPESDRKEDRAPKMVRLDLPEQVEIKLLIDYVSKRHGVNFIHDASIGGQRIAIHAPQPIPADSVMTLLESALRMNGMVLTRTDVPGMMRIQVSPQLTAIARLPGQADEDEPPVAVTRLFELKHAETPRVEQAITPFLTTGRANVISMPEYDMLIVTDFAESIARIAEIVTLVDRPAREVAVRFVSVNHVEADDLRQRLTQLLAGKAKATGATQRGASPLTIEADDRTNQLVIVGDPTEVAEAAALIPSFDVSLGTETKVYRFGFASPREVDELVKELIGELAAKRLYTSTVNVRAGLLIATATPEVHKQIAALREELDRSPDEQSPVRFYKLQNAKAEDVLETLMAIEGDKGVRDVSIDGASAGGGQPADVMRGPEPGEVNRFGANGGRDGVFADAGPRSVELPEARLMADEGSNTIIVIAKPAMQLVYEKLIKRLDVRRPQVLIEATVVALDTTDGFSLGVEVSASTDVNDGEGTMLNFSSFGLSEVDADTGRLTLKPGLGYNGAVISADIADIVIQAVASDSRAKVLSRPTVLVNDNATGTLTSENEEPYSSVNASSTVSTTSFGGFASAGTKISVTPQISEGDHLKLEYEIELSSFSDVTEELDVAEGVLPPARQTNNLKSVAVIPDGHTIVVGGLTRENYSNNVDRVPILGEIPVIEYLFSSRSTTTRKTTLFVFLRAVVLRDDQFEDLKMLSAEAAADAELPGDFPLSEPVEIR